MDLWDLTKMLFRRWYVFAPVLLVSLAVVLAMAQTVKPDYSAKGHLQLIPPPERMTQNQMTVKVNNRWLDLGFPALGSAVILQSQTEEVLSQLTDAGLTDNFTVTMEYGTTYLTIEAIGTSETQAVATVQQLMKVLDQLVGELQTKFSTTKQDQITTLALDRGDKVEAVTSKKKRVVIVAAGLALMLSVGLSIGIDALIRARRRRSGDDSEEPVDPVVAAAATARPDSTVVLRTPATVSRAQARAERGRGEKTVRIFPSRRSSARQAAEDESARNNEMTARAEIAARAKASVRPPAGRDAGAAPVNGQGQAKVNGPGQAKVNGQASVPMNGHGVGRQELRK